MSSTWLGWSLLSHGTGAGADATGGSARLRRHGPCRRSKGIDGLSSLVRSQFAEDPLGGTMYVSFARRGDRARVLYWDRDGYVLIMKRLEKRRERSKRHGAPRSDVS